MRREKAAKTAPLTAARDAGVILGWDSNKEILATGGGDILMSGSSGNSDGIYVTNTRILATTGTITLNGGTQGIVATDTGSSIGQKAGHASISNSTSDINIISDSLRLGSNTKIQSAGDLNITGYTPAITIGLAGGAGALNLTSTELDYIQEGFSSITFGDVNAGQITANAYTFSDNLNLISGAGGIQLAGAINVGANNLMLNSAGAVHQSGAIIASGLELSGAGNYTLNNVDNNVATVAANAGNIDYVDSNALTIGSVNATSGVTSTGTINISTLSGDLSVSENISTADTSHSAIVLNAGKTAGAGTSTGGNILISGTPTLSTGVGGQTTLLSGSIVGSTGLTSLIGSGTGRFRYNSDESATHYTSALGTGTYAIYREQPILTLTAEDKTVTYGTAPLLTTTVSSSQNGDTTGQSLNAAATVTVGGTTSTSGNYTAGDHILTPGSTASDTADQLGYAVSYIDGSLTILQKALTLSGITTANKIYDGNTTGTVNLGSVVISGLISGDDMSLSTVTGLFDNKNVGIDKTVALSSSYAGVDLAN